MLGFVKTLLLCINQHYVLSYSIVIKHRSEQNRNFTGSLKESSVMYCSVSSSSRLPILLLF